MIKKFLVGLGLFLSGGYAYAQTSTCAQTLRLARSVYEQGRFLEIPSLLRGCLQGDGFTDQEKIDALKILTLTYLYSEEPLLADSAMLELLRTDHFFEVNENVDPAEFTALYRTFRTKPLFAVGARFGANAALPVPLRSFYVGGEAGGNGQYSIGYNIQFGAVFEKKIFERHRESKWTAAPEIMFSNHKFTHTKERLTEGDLGSQPVSNGIYVHDISRINLNLLVQYKLLESIINPYFMAGGGISAITKATMQADTQFPQTGSVETGASIDFKKVYNTFDYAAIVGAGVKYKFGAIYLTGEVRYKYGLTNVINPSSRTDPEAAFDRGYVPNDMTLSTLSINIGFIFPYFNPKKLLK